MADDSLDALITTVAAAAATAAADAAAGIGIVHERIPRLVVHNQLIVDKVERILEGNENG
jgi:hypothetical protein